jgi:hypothetical protein
MKCANVAVCGSGERPRCCVRVVGWVISERASVACDLWGRTFHSEINFVVWDWSMCSYWPRGARWGYSKIFTHHGLDYLLRNSHKAPFSLNSVCASQSSESVQRCYPCLPHRTSHGQQPAANHNHNHNACCAWSPSSLRSPAEMLFAR